MSITAILFRYQRKNGSPKIWSTETNEISSIFQTWGMEVLFNNSYLVFISTKSTPSIWKHNPEFMIFLYKLDLSDGKSVFGKNRWFLLIMRKRVNETKACLIPSSLNTMHSFSRRIGMFSYYRVMRHLKVHKKSLICFI